MLLSVSFLLYVVVSSIIIVFFFVVFVFFLSRHSMIVNFQVNHPISDIDKQAQLIRAHRSVISKPPAGGGASVGGLGGPGGSLHSHTQSHSQSHKGAHLHTQMGLGLGLTK